MKLWNKSEQSEAAVDEKKASGPAGHIKNTLNPIRLGIIVLVIGFGSFLLWAAFAPLDEGVPCQGAVSIATKSKVVQHLQGGMVKAVHVREGQMVKEGDILISLENQTAKARFEEVHQHYLGMRAAESRLLAEQRGASRVTFHPDVVNDQNRQLVEPLMQSEKHLFSSRQNIVGLLRQQLNGLRELVREGYAPLNQQRDIEIKLAEIRSNMEQELTQVQREVQADEEKSIALADELAKTEIRAPVSGQVVGLQVQTVGAVVQPGQKIMDIVPLNESLLVEVRVLPHLIDRVHSGLIADVRFSSFAKTPQLVVPGEVESVSKDLLTEPRVNPNQPGASYYLALISITPEGIRTLGGRQLQPGMPVQVVIKTGEKSFLSYLVSPLIKRMSAAMKEE